MIHTHTHIHTHIHTCTYTHTHTHAHAHVRARTRTRTRPPTLVNITSRCHHAELEFTNKTLLTVDKSLRRVEPVGVSKSSVNGLHGNTMM